MAIDRSPGLSKILTAAVFDQIGNSLQQTALAVSQTASILTETLLPVQPLSPLKRFVLVTSTQFSGLLLAEAPFAPTAAPNSPEVLSDASQEVYQVKLTFCPIAIADFLAELRQQTHSSATSSALEQASPQLGLNDATIQSEFTLRLAEALITPPDSAATCDRVVATALQQQVEQEQLLNQVTTQILRNLKLSAILKIAVQEVQSLLQVDRVVVYEFDVPTRTGDPTSNFAMASHSVESAETAGRRSSSSRSSSSRSSSSRSSSSRSSSSRSLGIGRITYEARAMDTIPSVLDLVEGVDCFTDVLSPYEKYRKGMILAVDDVEANYAFSPCLLKLLRQAGVRAELIAPIVVQEELWGLLIVHQCACRQWQDREKAFLQRIAEHLAIAIQQAKLYEQLQHQTQMLEQRVVERTQELYDALLAAQTASRAKTEFLAAMSHELRTPLTCVIGMAETLLRVAGMPSETYSLQPGKQKDYLKIIKSSGEHLLELINDILDVSQVEAGKTVLNVSEFSLSQLAYQSLHMLRDQAHSRGVELGIDLQTSLEPFNHSAPTPTDRFIADRRRTSQILLNLLSNAIKFTPAGGRVTLRVAMRRNSAIFQVEDTGIGIPNDQHPLLFQKFQQLDSSYHRRYEGTGLGLALTKQLVELHGGSITVSSTVGKGSVFTVQLPAQSLVKDDRRPSKETAIHTTASTIATAEDSPHHSIDLSGQVVLVEDHEEVATLVCDLLTAAGCQVIWMIDGSTAIKQIEILQPPLVIIDSHLPDRDGDEIIKSLRQHPSLQTTKILILTAEALPEDICCLAEADDYLLKPIQPYQLLDKVAALLGEGEAKD